MSDTAWETLSNQAIAAAGVVYFLALLAHLVEWSALRTVPVSGSGQGRGPGRCGRRRDLRPSTTAGPATDEAKTYRIAMFGRLGLLLTIIAAGAHFVGLVGRGMAADPNRVPWGNMYEFTITGAFVVVGGLPAAAQALRPGLDGPDRHRHRGRAADGGRALLYDPVAPLTEALLSYWLVIHVVSAIIATGAFTLGGITSALYLVKSRALVTRQGQRPRLRRAAALAADARPGLLPDPRVRLPGLDLRGADQRPDLGPPGVVVVLELGPQGGVRVHHLGDLRRLPARPRRRPAGRDATPPSWRWSGLASLWFNFIGINYFSTTSQHSYANGARDRRHAPALSRVRRRTVSWARRVPWGAATARPGTRRRRRGRAGAGTPPAASAGDAASPPGGTGPRSRSPTATTTSSKTNLHTRQE